MTWIDRLRRRYRAVWLAAMLSVFGSAAPAAETVALASSPRRIISLAPSITEMVFALELGDRLVGVTRYCDYPPAAASIAKVGGYIDPSYEAIVALAPDLVILIASHRDAREQLEKLRLPTLSTPHQTIQDIHEAIRQIGKACGSAPAAEGLLSQFDRRTRAVRDAVRNQPRRRVLVCMGRDVGSGQLTGIYIAGRNGFYDQIIELAGGINAYTNTAIAIPQISAEGVIRLDPEVIVDLQSDMVSRKGKPGEAERQWSQLSMVAAVRDSRVHVLVGNQTLRPGPRYIDFLEQLARLLHPEGFPASVTHDAPDDRR